MSRSARANRASNRWLILYLAGFAALTSGCYQESPGPAIQETTRTLIALLDDPDGSVRRTAAEALGKIGDHEAASFLIKTLHDTAPTVREAAARSLGQLAPLNAPAAVGELLELFRDRDAGVRRAAVQSLGNIEQTSDLAHNLADLAGHAAPQVRGAAIQVLMLAEAGDISLPLNRLATDDDPATRQAVVAIAAGLAHQRGLPLVKDRLLRDPAPGVRAEAAYRLRLLVDEDALHDLDRAARTDESPAVRRWALQSVEEIRKGRDSGASGVLQ